jgi:hypothetical protein
MPFVQRVTTDEWVGVTNNLVTIKCDGIQRALDAIRRLDGEVRTEVSLEGPNKVLSVAGGNDGRYVCFIALNIDEMFLNLSNPTGSQESEVEVVAGGQAGTFPTPMLSVWKQS